MNRKAQTQYISWILLFGVVLMLSYVLYNWSIEQAEVRSQEIKQRTDPLLCAEVGIAIEGSCQAYNVMELNITNTGELDIVGISLRYIGVHPEEENYLQSNVLFDGITTGDSKKLKILKQGTLAQVTIIPLTDKKGETVFCEEQAVVREEGDLKQC